MVSDLILAALVVIALVLLWKILLRVIILGLVVGVIVLIFRGQPELGDNFWGLVNGAVEWAVEYGASVVEKLC